MEWDRGWLRKIKSMLSRSDSGAPADHSGNGQVPEPVEKLISGQYVEPPRSLYLLKWKLKKMAPATPAESVQAITWSPMARPMILSEAEAAVLTGQMHKSLAWIIVQLMAPGPGYTVAGIELTKMVANKEEPN